MKLVKSAHTEKLLRDVNAWQILALVAYRANRLKERNAYNLEQRQAVIGKNDFFEMSEMEYRCAKQRLASNRLATFKGTNQGTVATLLNSRVWDINAVSQQQTQQQASNRQATPNKNKEERNKNICEFLTEFDKARRAYPGRVRGLQTEFENFSSKHKDFESVLKTLLPAIKAQVRHRTLQKSQGAWVAEWPMFQTWINQRRWEEEVSAPKESVRYPLYAQKQDLQVYGIQHVMNKCEKAGVECLI